MRLIDLIDWIVGLGLGLLLGVLIAWPFFVMLVFELVSYITQR